MVMARTLPLSEVKAKLSEVVDEVVTTQERVTVTRNGHPVAVVLGTDDLEAIEETLAILSDPAAMREIQQGRAAIAGGDVVTSDDDDAPAAAGLDPVSIESDEAGEDLNLAREVRDLLEVLALGNRHRAQALH